jgi:threonine aldolase
MTPAKRIVELRSDTFTLPTESMRRAMTQAELGDDVYEEDPTVSHLQRLAADLVGKEAALFVPSGTMGNLCALLTHASPGDEVILELNSHIYHSEAAGGAVVGGLQFQPLDTPDGRLTPAQLSATIREEDIHQPHTGLLCIENTHNRKGGICLTPTETQNLASLAHAAGFPIHLDGARVFNAAVAQGIEVSALTQAVDSVMFCLSKGLSAPVGSMLAGSGQFIERARRHRKMLGGGMRQAGVIAAAGICALEEMVDRLKEDHLHARRLAEGLRGLTRLKLQWPVETNMVFVGCSHPLSAGSLVDLCADQGVRISQATPETVRMVTHRGVSEEDVDYAIEVIRAIDEAGLSEEAARSEGRRSGR